MGPRRTTATPGKGWSEVCIDDRDFIYGLASQINMEEAVERSRHTVAVLTKTWVDSRMVSIRISGSGAWEDPSRTFAEVDPFTA